VRADVDVPEVKALLVGCHAMQGYDKERAERVTDVVIDGLRAPREKGDLSLHSI
jgi:hypothetical protein